MPKSIIDEDLEYDGDKWLVFLMNEKNTQHAFIVIEGYFEEKNVVRRYKFDFMPTGIMVDYPNGSDFKSCIPRTAMFAESLVKSLPCDEKTGEKVREVIDPIERKGKVRTAIVGRLHKEKIESSKGQVRRANFDQRCDNNNDSETHFQESLKDGSDYQYRHWEINRNQRNDLVRNIEESMKNPPNFIYTGGKSFIKKRYPHACNCVTWAESQLEKIGINCGAAKLLDYILVAKPSKHVSFCIIL